MIKVIPSGRNDVTMGNPVKDGNDKETMSFPEATGKREITQTQACPRGGHMRKEVRIKTPEG